MKNINKVLCIKSSRGGLFVCAEDCARVGDLVRVAGECGAWRVARVYSKRGESCNTFQCVRV